MRASRILATLGFLGLVPGGILAAYAGYRAGVYSYGTIPLAFGAVFAAATACLFILLPVVRDRLG